ncbi:disintegrin and metalloproteinase domain-containing protein 22 isoform X3 [Carassius gibelio]|uniref:disintegrin and metalloproteinase domain-containing protein 22 isoform X3 n=1 Tax=Carassius gibelio TaxID=101364 RepID=UPI002278C5FA|nr:disintegrin and metalloproteinase domain-containing protein 22 isoform X3 [Carassius gibelio]
MLATRCLLLWAAVTARLAVTGWGSSIKRDGAERGSEQNAYSEELTQPQRLLQRSDAEEELPHGHLGTLVKIDADGAHLYLPSLNFCTSIRPTASDENFLSVRPIHLAQISFQVTAFGIPFVLDLELNHDLLSSNYVERHFDEDGRPFQSLGGEHCYYHGHVRGVQRSWAALSTCHGLQGMFSDGNFSYGIEPLHNSSDQSGKNHE